MFLCFQRVNETLRWDRSYPNATRILQPSTSPPRKMKNLPDILLTTLMAETQTSRSLQLSLGIPGLSANVSPFFKWLAFISWKVRKDLCTLWWKWRYLNFTAIYKKWLFQVVTSDCRAEKKGLKPKYRPEFGKAQRWAQYPSRRADRLAGRWCKSRGLTELQG